MRPIRRASKSAASMRSHLTQEQIEATLLRYGLAPETETLGIVYTPDEVRINTRRLVLIVPNDVLGIPAPLPPETRGGPLFQTVET